MGKRDRTTDEGTGPKVKTKKKRKDQSDGQPWRPVEMEDDFLTGLDEDGFMGLEELDAPVIFSLSKLQNAKPATGDAASAATAPAATSADRAVTTAVAVDGSDPPGKQKAQKKGKLKKLPKDRAPAVQAAAEVSAPNDASKAVPTGEAGQEKEAALDGSVIVPEAVEELKEGVRRQLERQRAQQERSKQKLAEAKAKVEAEKEASGTFVMPEGLSRKEQKKLLADQKRARHKAALRLKKAKIAERRRKYKAKKEARSGGSDDSSGSEEEGTAKQNPTDSKGPGTVGGGGEEADGPNMAAWDTFELHPAIVGALGRLGFTSPTPIQEACLMPAINGRRDIIGAAQTGSGKTLAFGLPILQRLLAEGGGEPGLPDRSQLRPSDLRCLILLPTRELALQVEQHLRAIARPCGITTAALVGGLSAVKQERVLSRRPAVVAATPGRLWDLMSGGAAASGGGSSGGRAAPHLTQLRALDFLVLDEADRMVQQGHFQDLANIIAFVTANRGGASGSTRNGPSASAAPSDDDASGSEPSDSDVDSADERSGGETSSNGEEAGSGSDDEAGGGGFRGHGRGGKGGVRGGRPLQTFVFSATLTLPENLRRRLRKGGGGAGGGTSSLDNLMDAVPFGDRPKVVDLTSDTQRLASRLQEAHLKCTKDQRDYLLYYILMRHPGRTLVFVNAISMTLRVSKILTHLSVPTIALHAGQQQRQRLKALDRFKQQPNGVLVATDVAARGLDVDNIRCVVHYDIPASADLYVHRSGRTARAAQDGVAVALITPDDSRTWDRLQATLDRPSGTVPEFPVEETLLPACKKRVALAMQLDKFVHADSKQQADHKWMVAAAADLGVDLQEDEVNSDGEITKGRKRRELQRRMKKAGRRPDNREESRLRHELAALLAEPLRAGFSQKYFTGGAAGAAAVLRTAAPATSSGAEAPAGAGMGAVVKMAAALQKSRTDAVASQEGARAAAAKREKREKKRAQTAAMLLHSTPSATGRPHAPGGAGSAADRSAWTPAIGTGSGAATDGSAAGGPIIASEAGTSSTDVAPAAGVEAAEKAAPAGAKGVQKGKQNGKHQKGTQGKGGGAASQKGEPATGSRSNPKPAKRRRGEAVPTALGRDAGGEDAVAALLKKTKH